MHRAPGYQRDRVRLRGLFRRGRVRRRDGRGARDGRAEDDTGGRGPDDVAAGAPGAPARLGAHSDLRRRHGDCEGACGRVRHRHRLREVRARERREEGGLNRRTIKNHRKGRRWFMATHADLILMNGRVATMDGARPFVSAAAVHDGRFIAAGSDDEVIRLRGPGTLVVDAHGRTVTPGLDDSHMHLIRGGLNYNMELRWDGVKSLADALSMLREQ